MVKEIYRAVKFICCIEFWRMSLLWTLSLVISHLRIFALRVWGHKYRNFPRQRVAPISASNRPICIITGVIVLLYLLMSFLMCCCNKYCISLCLLLWVSLLLGNIRAWSSSCQSTVRRGLLCNPRYLFLLLPFYSWFCSLILDFTFVFF